MSCRITGDFMAKKVALLASVIVLTTVCQGPALSQQRSTDVRQFEFACSTGNATACYELGVMYRNGAGVARNDARAASLFQTACQSGKAAGCYDLGVLYLAGEGVARDDVRAAKLFQTACDGGDGGGCNNIGALYARGQGVARDELRAVKLYERACAAGYALGCTNLANSSPQQASVVVDPQAIPADFRGEITYTGAYSGSVKTKPDRMRNLSLGEGLRSLTSSKTLPLMGDYQLTVRYEGNRISGNFIARSTAGPNGATMDDRGSLTGTRQGTACTFTTEGGGPPTTAYCGRGRWEWSNNDVFNLQGHKVALRIMANQTGMVDFAERERQQAIAAAEQQRIAAERARKEQAEAARLAALPRANATQTKLLADAIGQDSQSWSFNRYDVGSLTNVRIDNASGITQVRGDYTYNGGRRGWISGRLANGKVGCVVYHDTTSCEPVRKVVQPIAKSQLANSSSTDPELEETFQRWFSREYTEDELRRFRTSWEERIQYSMKSDNPWQVLGQIETQPSCFAKSTRYIPSHTIRTGSVIVSRDRSGEVTEDRFSTVEGYEKPIYIYVCESQNGYPIDCVFNFNERIELFKGEEAIYNYSHIKEFNRMIREGKCIRAFRKN